MTGEVWVQILSGEPEWLFNLYTVVVGLICGSFANVLIHRLPRDESFVKPRSRCPSCKKPILWWQNIPVVSYLALRGRCANCEARISLRYPVIELVTAALFLFAKHRMGWDVLLWLREWPFLVSLVAITFIDLEHRIIPDKLSLSGVVWGLATAYWVPGFGIIDSFLGAAVGFSIFYAMAVLYHRFAGREGLGGGDIKLLAMLGAFLGVQGVFVTILVSSVVGTVIGVSIGLTQRARGRSKSRILDLAIPYGPFLVIGALVYHWTDRTLWLPFMTPM